MGELLWILVSAMLVNNFTLMLFLAYAIPPHFYFRLNYDVWVFLPLIIIPIAVRHLMVIWNENDKTKLNPQLEKTARFMAIFGLLFCIGIII